MNVSGHKDPKNLNHYDPSPALSVKIAMASHICAAKPAAQPSAQLSAQPSAQPSVGMNHARRGREGYHDIEITDFKKITDENGFQYWVKVKVRIVPLSVNRCTGHFLITITGLF
jgi:hypothetical protein